jgi:RimJ/RimL family protein N-acetyltransferase
MTRLQDGQRYPRALECEGRTLQITRMAPADRDDLVAFVAALPPHDLLFLRRDISNARVIDAWIAAVWEGRVHSLVLRDGGRLVGCTAVVTEDMTWSKHVGELRVLIDPGLRGKGVGQVLVQECFATALGLGLAKLTVQMTVDQRAAIATFESLGFRAEALHRDHVRDRDGQSHDLVVLGHDVSEVLGMMDMYGVTDAVESRPAG